jgi:hypothetical protein
VTTFVTAVAGKVGPDDLPASERKLPKAASDETAFRSDVGTTSVAAASDRCGRCGALIHTPGFLHKSTESSRSFPPFEPGHVGDPELNGLQHRLCPDDGLQPQTGKVNKKCSKHR